MDETAPNRGIFERDPIPYALDTDWPVGAAGFEPLHLEIRSAELHLLFATKHAHGALDAECRFPYALDTDWPVGAAGFEPPHFRIRSRWGSVIA